MITKYPHRNWKHPSVWYYVRTTCPRCGLRNYATEDGPDQSFWAICPVCYEALTLIKEPF